MRALEDSRTLRFAGRTLAPSVELGVYQDGGDAETGLGLERVETRVDEIGRDIGELRDHTGKLEGIVSTFIQTRGTVEAA